MTEKQQRLLDAATILAASLICAGVIGMAYFVDNLIHGSDLSQTSSLDEKPSLDASHLISNLPSHSSSDPSQSLPTTPSATESTAFIDLQPTVDQWLNYTNRQVGLVIYDLDNDRVAASYQPNTIFYTASIYKLFFAYDGYQQLTNGAIDGDKKFVTTTDKGDLTYSECLDYMIRESYNPCADPIRENTTAERRVSALIKRLGLTNTSNYGLDSTASDLTKLLQLYYEHPDLASRYWAQLADSMLDQPATTYDWRQGLPSGFSDQVLVYDKVGWSYGSNGWDVFNDAAIIDFPTQNRHYTVVVLSRNTSSSAILSRLGRMLEQAITSTS